MYVDKGDGEEYDFHDGASLWWRLRFRAEGILALESWWLC